MKRILLLGFLACTIAIPSVKAFRPPTRAPLPNYDKRTMGAPSRPALSPPKAEAAARLKDRVPGLRLDVDPIIGSPQFVSSSHGFLTGPNGLGKGVSARFQQGVPAQDPHRVLKAFLNEHSALFGHGAEVLDSANFSRDYVTEHNGLKTTVWEQQVDGIPVFQALLIGHVTKDGELVNISSQFIPDSLKAAAKGTPNHAALRKSAPISSRRAVVEAAKNIGEALSDAQIVALDPQPSGAHQQQRFNAAGVLNGDTDARLV